MNIDYYDDLNRDCFFSPYQAEVNACKHADDFYNVFKIYILIIILIIIYMYLMAPAIANFKRNNLATFFYSWSILRVVPF